MTTKWRIEKITEHHAAHVNNPDEYPVCHWYATSDPDDEALFWIEFCEPTWEKAIERAETE